MRGLHLRAATAVDYAQTGHRARIVIRSLYGFGERGVTKRTRDNALDDRALKFCARLREKARSETGATRASCAACSNRVRLNPAVTIVSYSCSDIGRTARPKAPRFVEPSAFVSWCSYVVSAFLKRDGVIELEIVHAARVIVILPRRFRSNLNDTGGREIGLHPSAAGPVSRRSPWLAIDGPIANGRLDLTQIGSRKVIPTLAVVIVGRRQPRGQNDLRHVAPRPGVALSGQTRPRCGNEGGPHRPAAVKRLRRCSACASPLRVTAPARCGVLQPWSLLDGG